MKSKTPSQQEKVEQMRQGAEAERDGLSAKHQKTLKEESAISEEVIKARGYRTIKHPDELKPLGFAPMQRQVPGLLLPLHTVHKDIPATCVYRPDNPRINKDSKIVKYEFPKGESMRLDCPPACQAAINDPKVPLWITEGQKKADSLASHGLCAIALLGVWNFKGKNDKGGVTILPDWDYVALNGREVRIVFDNDVIKKYEVRQALAKFTAFLERKKAQVKTVYLPDTETGAKAGVDDFLAAGHTVEDLLALAKALAPEPKAAASTVEWMDKAPTRLHRPLMLIDGHAYAASWIYTETTIPESTDKQGNIVKHNPPLSVKSRELYVVRDDGQIFGPGCTLLEELGFDVVLSEVPPDEKLWQAPAVRAYCEQGVRPVPADVFRRVTDTVNRFIDFDRSLGEQREMAEMVACYVLSTWFLDAFNVVGFLWPNGERGCGKTQLLHVICQMGYLGQVILSGGSFAALRDLADYGACLAFDDAEGLSDPKRTDPDKRALLLAGNRRGSYVTVKEPMPDRTWRTRYVNTYCPRSFSAIRLPDAVLASRSIVVPLVRTPDSYRANADPLEYKLWPHDRRTLLDDLWTLGLSCLKDLPAYEKKVNEQTELLGRDLEPWRAILAVASWLDAHGVPGLWKKMMELSMNYQKERPEFESGDLKALVTKALCRCAEGVKGGSFVVRTADVTDLVKQIAQETEADINLELGDPNRRVGRVLKSMRLEKKPSHSGGRGWVVKIQVLRREAQAYGVSWPQGEGAAGREEETPAGSAEPVQREVF